MGRPAINVTSKVCFARFEWLAMVDERCPCITGRAWFSLTGQLERKIRDA
jgi:hypothetical protein